MHTVQAADTSLLFELPCFTANRERKRAAAQLAAQENVRYKDSYLRAFDPARPLHLESWVRRDMQQGFTDELQRLRPARCRFCGKRWFAAQTPTHSARRRLYSGVDVLRSYSNSDRNTASLATAAGKRKCSENRGEM